MLNKSKSSVILNRIYEWAYRDCYSRIRYHRKFDTESIINRLKKKPLSDGLSYNKNDVKHILKLQNDMINETTIYCAEVFNEQILINHYSVECEIKLKYLKELKIVNLQHNHSINLDLLWGDYLNLQNHSKNLDFLKTYERSIMWNLNEDSIKKSNDRTILLIKYRLLYQNMNYDIERKINDL